MSKGSSEVDASFATALGSSNFQNGSVRTSAYLDLLFHLNLSGFHSRCFRVRTVYHATVDVFLTCCIALLLGRSNQDVRNCCAAQLERFLSVSYSLK